MKINPIEKKWVVAPKIPGEVNERLSDYSHVMRQLLYNRGIEDAESAQRYLSEDGSFHDPFLLNGMHSAVQILLDAVSKGSPIAVYGDYDVDGISATALMTIVLKRIGGIVTPYIPDRFSEGYGINTIALDNLSKSGVSVLLTVDCGIRSINELNYAKENLGLQVIVSDHHAPLEVLPQVDAIICQKIANDPYPEKNLSGVGLAFKISQALMEKYSGADISLNDVLDLAALGTIADVVPLVGENRTIVKKGLQQLRKAPRVGLKSLMGVSQLKANALVAMDISFGLAPRLNAVGRLESVVTDNEDVNELATHLALPQSAQKALTILLTEDLQLAGQLAQELDNLNRIRQKLTRDMQGSAEELINNQDFILFASAKTFNSGLVGLVAAKLTETYYRPTIIGFTGEHSTRASCRSIKEFHITEALDRCQDLLIQHGGHAMAAGFTVANENVPVLIERINSIAKETMDQEAFKPSIMADIDISLDDIPRDILKDLDLLEPIGAGNAGATFISRNVNVITSRTVGEGGPHLKLKLGNSRKPFDAIAFRQGHWITNLPKMVDILYHIERNFFNGAITTQLNIKDIQHSKPG